MTHTSKNKTKRAPGILAQAWRMQSLPAIRAWLGLSLAAIGRELARLTGRKSYYDRSTVWVWEQRGECPAAVLPAYGTLIANRVADVLRTDDLGVTIEANPLLHVRVLRRCVECRDWFEWRRANQRRCAACIERRRSRSTLSG